MFSYLWGTLDIIHMRVWRLFWYYIVIFFFGYKLQNMDRSKCWKHINIISTASNFVFILETFRRVISRSLRNKLLSFLVKRLVNSPKAYFLPSDTICTVFLFWQPKSLLFAVKTIVLNFFLRQNVSYVFCFSHDIGPTKTQFEVL